MDILKENFYLFIFFLFNFIFNFIQFIIEKRLKVSSLFSPMFPSSKILGFSITQSSQNKQYILFLDNIYYKCKTIYCLTFVSRKCICKLIQPNVYQLKGNFSSNTHQRATG